MQTSCAVILPAYTDSGAVQETVARMLECRATIPDYQTAIICINNGSSDGSGEMLDGRAGVAVVTHQDNRCRNAVLPTEPDYRSREWSFATATDGTCPSGDFPQRLSRAQGQVQMALCNVVADDPVGLLVNRRDIASSVEGSMFMLAAPLDRKVVRHYARGFGSAQTTQTEPDLLGHLAAGVE